MARPFFLSVSKSTQYGFLELTEQIRLRIREEINFPYTTISIFHEETLTQEQQEYLQGFFETLLIHLHEPRKKNLIEFFIDVSYRITHAQFINWSITKNNRGDVSHLMIESPLRPESQEIEGYESVTKLNNNYIYQFKTIDIGRIVFKEKTTL